MNEAFFHLLPMQAALQAYKRQSSGGKADKKAKAIMAETERILSKARELKATEVFKVFPDPRHARTITFDDGEYIIYRDGKTLVQVDPRGREHKVGIRSFTDRYVPKARPRTK